MKPCCTHTSQGAAGVLRALSCFSAFDVHFTCQVEGHNQA